MSQHDFSIANQGFPATRSDLNNALQALASLSAGSTAPSTTYACMLWYDSTNNLLKMRNADNDAWVTLGFAHPTSDVWLSLAYGVQAINAGGLSLKTDEGTIRFFVKDNGQVGVNTSSPAYPLDINHPGGGQYSLTINDQSDISKPVGLYLRTTGAAYINAGTGSTMRFTQGGTEVMRLDANNDLCIGTTSLPNGTSVYGAGFDTSASNDRSLLNLASSVSTAIPLVQFMNPNGIVGTISTLGGSTSYNTSSDYRLKENVTPVTGAINKLRLLKPKSFNFKSDKSKTVDGFLAHELQEVLPEAVTGVKDGTKTETKIITPAKGILKDTETGKAIASGISKPGIIEDGHSWTETTPAVTEDTEVPDYQGVDQSKLTPLLVAALQEALTKIDQLEARITSLEL